MAKIGYARVSTRSQNDDSQVDDLTACGCEKIFTDTASGKNAARPELDKALAYLRAGDVFVITRLSRAMRSLKHLLALADELRERGVGLVVLKQQIDTTTPQGRLVFHLLGAIDEFQRELIVPGRSGCPSWWRSRWPWAGAGNPAGRVPGGVLVAGVSWWQSVCRGLLGDGGAGGGFVGDGLAGGVGGEQGGDGEPVDGAGHPAGVAVDGADRVVGEEGVGPAGQRQVGAEVPWSTPASAAVRAGAG